MPEQRKIYQKRKANRLKEFSRYAYRNNEKYVEYDDGLMYDGYGDEDETDYGTGFREVAIIILAMMGLLFVFVSLG